MASKECNICCEPFTAKVRAPIKCINYECDIQCCKKCFENNYLKSEEFNLVTLCCRKPITLNQIFKITNNLAYGKKILERYTEHTIESQKNLLPATQEAAKNVLELREREAWRRERWEETKRLKRLIEDIKDDIYASYRVTDIKKEKNEYTFIKECSREDCKGMLSSAWKCGLCEKFTCSKCHLPKEGQNDTNHQCDEDAVKNIEALKKDTKPCPSCGFGIFKINGCDLMWCSKCRTSFSWRTGKINNGGYNHNPHYMEFLRSQNINPPRAPGDNPGQRGFDIDECFDPFDRVRTIGILDYLNHTLIPRKIDGHYRQSNIYIACNRIMRFGRHLTAITIPHFQYDLDRIFENLRIGYLIKDITEEKWKKDLSMNIKKSNKRQLQYEVADTFLKIYSDTFRNIIVILEEEVNFKEKIETQLDTLMKYVSISNDEFKNIKKLFGSSENIKIEIGGNYNFTPFPNDIDFNYNVFSFEV